MTSDSVERAGTIYDTYPYPSPTAGDDLIRDVANLIAFLYTADALAGKRVLDAGCGTGHRLVALAKAFPKTQFLGVDLTPASLEVARALAARHKVGNLRLERGNLLSFEPREQFDLIVSTGVIHHLADPARGLANLRACLAPGASLVLWLYHRLGEYQRLLERELALTLWDRESMSLQQGVDILRGLNISLSRGQYSGSFARRDNAVLDETSIDVDAYLNPIVNTYRFEDALSLLAGCGLDWCAFHSISLGHEIKLIDITRVSRGALGMFCLKLEPYLTSPLVCERYEGLPVDEKLRVVELVTRPTGFVVVAGRDDAQQQLDARMRGNLVRLNG